MPALPSFSPFARARAAVNRPAGLHRAVQYAFLAFYLYVGLRFYAYTQWAMGASSDFVPKPASVEAFLPISSLLAAKRLLLTGEYDFVHPAGLTILLLAVVSSLLFRKGFCGYLCPVGTLSMLLDRLGKRLGLSRRMPGWLSLLLSLPKYLLLLFFANLLLINMDLASIEGFLRTPYNMVADTKMLLFFLNPTPTLLVIMGVLLLGGMLFPAFWCRGFCPYGALLGLFSLFSPLAVRRKADRCTGCRRCSRACPSRIPVHEKSRVSNPECLGCTECMGACPEQGCLDLHFGYTAGARVLSFRSAAVGTLLLLCLFYFWAVSSGNWTSRIPQGMIRQYHNNILQMEHP